ncbi:Acetate kinase [Buchnera aphidicola (Periphyllus testudinaceus)]|uniref:acetate/propionate family kinase n=1 Tax=Buchnera aphidicola TaxID=9 RepID=UPI003464DFD4
MSKKLILVLNCGSSSLKFSILDPISKKIYIFGIVECLFLKKTKLKLNIFSKLYIKFLDDYTNHNDALDFVLNFLKEKYLKYFKRIHGIGHRVVHGGINITQSVVINDKIILEIEKSSVFAPLHNPANLIGIKLSYKFFPNLRKKNVAVFDTSFYSSLPKIAYLYAIPYKFYKKYKIKRYGAHGISHNYVMKQSSYILKKKKSSLNIISCHLGNGSSVTAIKNGKSIDTSMGLTPLEGLVMGTRSGDLDPAIIFFMHKKIGISLDKIEEILTKKSGFLGISEKSSDCRFLEKNFNKNKKEKLAIEIFCYRLAKYISSYSILMDNRLDAIIFTGGIGENSQLIRKIVISKLSLLGFYLDNNLNNTIKTTNNYFINKKNSRSILVIPTNEELFIALETYKLIKLIK